MPPCGRCGHDNASHLRYCFSCGRRLADVGARLPSAFSPTVATARATTPARGDATPAAAGAVLPRALDSLRYVYVVAARRLNGGDRQRQIGEDRARARQALDEATVDLGERTLAALDGAGPPELAETMEAIRRERTEQATLAADHAAAERVDAGEEAQRAREREAAAAEQAACEQRLGLIDQRLAALEAERRQIDVSGTRDPDPATDAERGARSAALDRDGRTLLEQAAALRAAAMAARSRSDRAATADREARAGATSRSTARAQERLAAAQRLRALTATLGTRTAATSVTVKDRDGRPLSGLAAQRAGVDRLQQILARHDQQLARLAATPTHTDRRKLATGIALLAAILFLVYTLGASLRALFR